MTYLTSKDPNTGKTPVEVYIQKQTAWAKAQDAWDAANIQAKSKLNRTLLSQQFPHNIDAY